jgi:hypothetical protein
MRNTGLLLIVIAVLAGGCTPKLSIKEPTQLLDVAGPVAVDVRTFGGDVTVHADRSLTQAAVTVTRISTHGFMRGDEAEAAIESIGYSVELTSGDIGQVLQVRATTSHPEPHFQEAKVEIFLPEVVGMTVRTGTGEIEAIDIAGPIDIETTSGNVVIATTRPLIDPIRIVTSYGDVDLRMRGESAGAIDIDTSNGTVFYRVRYGQSVILPGTDQDTIFASFNEGANPVHVRTDDGDIRFIVVDDPLTYGLMMIE